MKMTEIMYRAEVKEWEKLQARLERQKKALEKAEAKAEKFGIKEWTRAEYRAWIETVEVNESFFIKNKADQDKNSAWFDLGLKRDAVTDTEKDIERCEARLAKKTEAYEQAQAEREELEKVTGKEELMMLDFQQEQKEWLKDGIILEERYWGSTPKGKRFIIYRNSFGMTMRSLHCYTLKIGGETIFTSGLFWRCYSVIKNS